MPQLPRKSGQLYRIMNLKFATPSPALQPYIKRYWAVENSLSKDKEHTQRIIPTGLPELTFYFGDRPKSERRNLEGNTVLNGQQNDFYDLFITGNLSMFAITFQSNGLSQFLKIPINELQNQTIFLGLIDKVFSQYLEDNLAEAETFQHRVNIVENYFKTLIHHQTTSVDDKRMRHAVDLIRLTKGSIAIDFLASSSCLSRKQFERIFLSNIGISPKQFLKIIRFQNAIRLKQLNFHIGLTEIAYAAGYYDQSHFINEIKELTGRTPKRLFGKGDIISDFF